MNWSLLAMDVVFVVTFGALIVGLLRGAEMSQEELEEAKELWL